MNNCKFYKQEKYESLDGGFTWSAMGIYQKGELIESESVDCGYVPPVFDGKFFATYNDSTTYSAACDSDTSLTTATTQAHTTSYRNMTTAEIGSCITSIGNAAFMDCTSLTSVTIGSGVTSIGNQAFQSCSSLTSIDIPNSVTSIGNDAFRLCSGLTNVTLGNGVTSIGGRAFGSCSGLTSVTVTATTPPTLGRRAFDNTNNCPIYVPSGSVETYKAASGWNTYYSRIQAIPT